MAPEGIKEQRKNVLERQRRRLQVLRTKCRIGRHVQFDASVDAKSHRAILKYKLFPQPKFNICNACRDKNIISRLLYKLRV